MASFEFGRDRSPEDEAAEIMNQSDEGLDDLMEGTEVNEGDDAFESGDEEVDSESDDGGDFAD